MRKFLAIILLALLSITVFTACDSLKHEHTKSDWKYSESEHWRVPECNRKNCVVESIVYGFGEHTDEDENGTCDVCGYEGVIKKVANP